VSRLHPSRADRIVANLETRLQEERMNRMAREVEVTVLSSQLEQLRDERAQLLARIRQLEASEPPRSEG